MLIFTGHRIVFIFSLLRFFSQLCSLSSLSSLINLIIFFTKFWTSIFIGLKHLVPSILVEVIYVTCMNAYFRKLFFSFFFLECFDFFTDCNLSFLLILNYFIFSEIILFDKAFFCSIFLQVLHDDSVPLLFCWI